MADSILDTTKQVLDIEPSDTSFDIDIIMHINSVFATLHQVGVGPADGFEIINKDAEWSAFITGKKLNSVKTYVCLRVRMLFDPPTTSFAITAMEKQFQEFEWRLKVAGDTSWTDPTVPEEVDE